MSNDLFNHIFRISDDQCTLWTTLSVKACTCHRSPSSLLPNLSHGMSVAWIEIIDCLLRRLCYIALRMYAYLQLVGCMSSSPPCLLVAIDKWPEAVRFAANDCNHQGES